MDKIRGKDPRALMGNAGDGTSRAEAREFMFAVKDNLLPSIDSLLEHRADLCRLETESWQQSPMIIGDNPVIRVSADLPGQRPR